MFAWRERQSRQQICAYFLCSITSTYMQCKSTVLHYRDTKPVLPALCVYFLSKNHPVLPRVCIEFFSFFNSTKLGGLSSLTCITDKNFIHFTTECTCMLHTSPGTCVHSHYLQYIQGNCPIVLQPKYGSTVTLFCHNKPSCAITRVYFNVFLALTLIESLSHHTVCTVQ